jgi:hypothetical protein
VEVIDYIAARGKCSVRQATCCPFRIYMVNKQGREGKGMMERNKGDDRVERALTY